MTRGLVTGTSGSARGAAEWRRGSPGSLDVVFLLTSSLDAAAAPGRFQRVPGRVPVYGRCRQEAESPGGMERFFLERWSSGCSRLTKSLSLPGRPIELPSRRDPAAAARRCCARRRRRPSTACCGSPLVLSPNGRRRRVDRTAVLRWLSVLVGPAVAYCPNRRRVVTAILSSLDQRGCGVAPGRGRW